jgi:hypothetical protein
MKKERVRKKRRNILDRRARERKEREKKKVLPEVSKEGKKDENMPSSSGHLTHCPAYI